MKRVIILLIILLSLTACSQKETEQNYLQLTIPEEIENNCFGFVIGAPDEVELISEIGGGWARPHPGPFAWGFIETEKDNFDFDTTDAYVRSAQENNIAILGTIWPYADWDQAICHSKECQVTKLDIFYPSNENGFQEGIPLSRCEPCNYKNYNLFISKLVERYDGDNTNDMPGLTMPIKYWEVLNEPEMSSEEMTFFKGNKDEYINIISNTSQVIKETCNDCKVLHGGAAGTQDFMIDYWTYLFNNEIPYDIANIHSIRSNDKTLNVNTFKTLTTKPIWVTEAEFNSESEILSSVEGAFNTGAEKIFFTQFKIGEYGTKNGYSSTYDSIKCK